VTGENQSNRRKICPITTLSTNTTCTGPESNTVLNVETPATNRLFSLSCILHASMRLPFGRGKSKYSEKNLSQCHFVHHNPTWTDPGSNLRLRGEGPATNHLFSLSYILHTPTHLPFDTGKSKYSEKNLSQCPLVHHKSHMDRPGIESGPPR
jgi:hypothetical protein